MKQQQQYYAGFWWRVWASIVDSVWLGLLILVLLFLLGEKSTSYTYVMSGLINWLLPALLIIAFWFFRASSPGKMAVSASIIDANSGGKPKLWQLVLRYIGYFLSLLPLGLGFIWLAFDARKQAWHDKLAQTVVVRDCSDPKRNRIILLISILAVIIISGMVYYFFADKMVTAMTSKNDPTLQVYIDDGFAFGEGESEETCWQEARWRMKQCKDLYCEFGQVYFLKACLAASEASRSTIGINQ